MSALSRTTGGANRLKGISRWTRVGALGQPGWTAR